MRILLATYWRMPHVGGVNTFLQTLKKELELQGHQADVLAYHPSRTKIYLVDKEKEIDIREITNLVANKVFHYYERYFPTVEPWIRWQEVERYAFELAISLFDLSGYDLIHTQDAVSARAFWRIKPDHIPQVATLHGLIAYEYVHSGMIVRKDSLRWKYLARGEYYGAVSSDCTMVPTRWLLQE